MISRPKYTPCPVLIAMLALLIWASSLPDAARVLASDAPAAETLLFVACDGNDQWSGRQARPNADASDGPLATLAAARDALRKLRDVEGKLPGPVRVVVGVGTYYLGETLRLGPDDSGTTEAPITYEARSDEEVVLSGGRAITGWKPHQGKIYRSDVRKLFPEGFRLRHLFYNAKRLPVARVPNVDPQHPRTGGWSYVVETYPVADYDPAKMDRGWFKPYDPVLKKHLLYDTTEIDAADWSHPELAEVSIFPWQCWNNNIVSVQSIDPKKGLIEMADKGASYKIICGNRFFVQNVFEELDAPGEWYHDAESGTLYLWPPDNSLPEATVVAAVLDSIVQIMGDARAKRPVTHVRLAGFHLEACAGRAVVLDVAENCTIARSTIRGTGAEAVWLGSRARACRVLGNDISDTGCGGVEFARGGRENLVSNNHIHHFSEVYRHRAGIKVRGEKNVVSHNLVHDCPRSGIFFGGSENVVELNDVHHVNLEACDSAMVGMFAGSYDRAAGQHGNVIRFNRISNSEGYCMVCPGQWTTPHHTMGIRMDDCGSNATIYGNLIIGAVRGVHLHSGSNNTVKNNVLIENMHWQMGYSNHLAEYKKIKSDMSGNRFVRNIVCYTQPEAHLYAFANWTDRIIAESDHNLFFTGGMPIRIRRWPGQPRELSLEGWQATGYDTHSIVADPMFVDPAAGNFRLKDDSPAWKLGFKPIPLEKIGLHAGPNRASWPVPDGRAGWRETPVLQTGPHPE